jgi:heme/copper-type cytochrome/quinol oxidase subunit 4
MDRTRETGRGRTMGTWRPTVVGWIALAIYTLWRIAVALTSTTAWSAGSALARFTYGFGVCLVPVALLYFVVIKVRSKVWRPLAVLLPALVAALIHWELARSILY